MPTRSDPIRRCAFKLPRNDKYQCQKAGDKYQPGMEMWYCRFHDGHAKDRCQVLVEWAGKGAQCEQLGYLDKETGKKLCEWHAMSSNGDGWPQVEDTTPRKRKDSARSVEQVDTHVEDLLVPGCSVSTLVSSSSTAIEQANHAPCLPQADAESTTKEPKSIDSETEEHILPARKSTINAEVINDNNPICPATPILENISTSEREEVCDLVTTSTTNTHAHGFHKPPAAHPPQRVFKPVVRTTPDEPHNLHRPSHTRVDSFELIPPCTISPTPRTPTPPTPPTLQTLIRSFQFPTVHHSTPLSDASSPSRITFLFALQAAAPSPTRLAAGYVQCCVCLEKHGEYNMREVEGCGHRYRALCLKKARKMGVLRRFNCGGCRVWMGE